MKKIVSCAVLTPVGCTVNLRFSKSVPALTIEILEIVLFAFFVLNLWIPDVSAVVKPTVLIPAE